MHHAAIDAQRKFTRCLRLRHNATQASLLRGHEGHGCIGVPPAWALTPLPPRPDLPTSPGPRPVSRLGLAGLAVVRERRVFVPLRPPPALRARCDAARALADLLAPRRAVVFRPVVLPRR